MEKKNFDLYELKVEVTYLAELCKFCNVVNFKTKLSKINRINDRCNFVLSNFIGVSLDFAIKGNSIDSMEYEKVILHYKNTTIYCDVETGNIEVET